MDANVTLIAAFGAGLLSFVSPCVLPLVPPYLGFLTGASIEELTSEEMSRLAAKRRAAEVSLCFILGFTCVFVTLGATASVFGQLLRQWSEVLGVLAGLFIIVMGLHFLGLFRVALFYREARFHQFRIKAGLGGAFLLGLAFAFGWTPCIGPVLATILSVAGSRDTVGDGALLLAVYSLGLGVPFLIAALFAAKFVLFMRRFRRHFPLVERAMGGVLVITGALFLSGGMQRASFWLLENFPALSTIG
ncbi:cytochrome c biogenesis CcdA family protein [Pleomorphomonas sp. NRK KF1]|uniref:cytochrome c biogenesis CcdA family protein n=1 Tax=Pleomorphomonas sp. NRK KF1 TaxID=2943000 RepID=UPI0020445010|nr:cytochrome c biogenesis protein CcdA [Pleomorphomonas sp. NRK KF1]MCM5552318.1 cytochrome c biogenesis protein CcdA [Pleomorphomonas sp. NRK KF1]